MKKVILFDVDRTLVDSYKSEFYSLQEAIKLATGKKISEEEFTKITTLPTIKFFESMGFDDKQIDLINESWSITFKKYKTLCFDGIKEMISILYEKGYTLGIITSRTKEEFHELDEELKDINKFFKVVVTSDMITNHKPNRESIDYICNKLNCISKDIIHIGDSIVDKELANNSDCYFIPAVWDNKELIGSNDECYNPKELLKHIIRIDNN